MVLIEEKSENSQQARKTVSEVVLKGTASCDVWDVVVKANQTSHSEIEEMKANGLEVVFSSYFTNGQSGVFVIADNFGYFTLIRKDSKFNKDLNEPNQHDFKLHKRAHSGFDQIKLFKSQSYLNLFANDHQVGFLRAFDGQIANETCLVTDSIITTLDFDQEVTGRFYVGTESGDIYVFSAEGNTGIV